MIHFLNLGKGRERVLQKNKGAFVVNGQLKTIVYQLWFPELSVKYDRLIQTHYIQEVTQFAFAYWQWQSNDDIFAFSQDKWQYVKTD